MARVYKSDILRLFEEAKEIFERDNEVFKERFSLPQYYQEFTTAIRDKIGIELNSDTFYKQFHIKLASHKDSVIGYSWSYLNALCRYVHNENYLDKYKLYQTDPKQEVNKSEDIDPRDYYNIELVEFPPLNPSFPATPTFKFDYEGYNKLYLKDESQNPTGTHKDRMAWEVFLFLKRELINQLHKNNPNYIPSLSLISSGSAAIAIYEALTLFKIPFRLNIIYDKKLMPEKVFVALSSLNKEMVALHPVNLTDRKLDSDAILKLTNNIGGIDLTFGKGVQKVKDNYYDWLSYEILNQSPDYCFVPFGSGDLLRNLLLTSKTELEAENPSKRFFGNKRVLKNCHFLGATTYNKKSQMDKIFSPPTFHPGRDFHEYLKEYECGDLTDVYEVDEEYVKKAVELAEEKGFTCEPSGVAGLALFLEKKETFSIPKNKKIVIINTGKLKLEKYLDIKTDV